MGLAAGVPAHTCMVCHSRRGRCGGNHGIPTVVAAAAATVVVVVWLVGLSAPAPVWAGVPARPQVPAAVVVVAAAMWAVTVPTGIVAVVAGTVVGFPAAGSALAAVATGAVVVAAAMWAATVLAGIVAVVAGTVVGFPTAGSALAAVATGAVVGVVAVGEIQGPAVVRVWWCYSGGQRLTRRAYWHCFRVGRS